MALPWRRCYSIERLLRGVQISSSRPPCVSLSLLLSLSVSLFLSLLVSHTSSLSRSLLPAPFSLPLLPLAAPPDLRFLLVVLVLVLHLLLLLFLLPHLSVVSLSSLSPLFTFPLSLVPRPLLLPSSLSPSLGPLIPLAYPSLSLLSLAPASFSRLLVTRRRPPSTFSS